MGRHKPSLEKEYMTVIRVQKGLISLIEPDGSIATYRQTRIMDLKEEDRQTYIDQGILSPDWAKYPQIPKHYLIYSENEDTEGPPRRAFFPDEQPIPQSEIVFSQTDEEMITELFGEDEDL